MGGMDYLKEDQRSALRHSPSQRPSEMSPSRSQGSSLHLERVQPNSGANFGGTYDRIEQQEFSKVLKDNIFLEREAESAKIETALKPDFNLLDAFKIFDTKGIGNVSVQDMIVALKENLNFHDFTHDDIYLLFRRNDKNNDGKLNF